MPLDVVSSHEPYKPLYIVLCCQKMLLLGSAVPVNELWMDMCVCIYIYIMLKLYTVYRYNTYTNYIHTILTRIISQIIIEAITMVILLAIDAATKP